MTVSILQILVLPKRISVQNVDRTSRNLGRDHVNANHSVNKCHLFAYSDITLLQTDDLAFPF